jgi:hypothetical protein
MTTRLQKVADQAIVEAKAASVATHGRVNSDFVIQFLALALASATSRVSSGFIHAGVEVDQRLHKAPRADQDDLP